METKGEGERGRMKGRVKEGREAERRTGEERQGKRKSGRGRQERKEENGVGISLHYPPLLIHYSLQCLTKTLIMFMWFLTDPLS